MCRKSDSFAPLFLERLFRGWLFLHGDDVRLKQSNETAQFILRKKRACSAYPNGGQIVSAGKWKADTDRFGYLGTEEAAELGGCIEGHVTTRVSEGDEMDCSNTDATNASGYISARERRVYFFVVRPRGL